VYLCRKAADQVPALKAALLKAMELPKKVVNGRFARLKRREEFLQVREPASDVSIQDMVDCLKLFEPDVTIESLSSKINYANLPKLKTWIDNHCEFSHYMLQVQNFIFHSNKYTSRIDDRIFYMIYDAF
jgi:hypothetical protein